MNEDIIKMAMDADGHINSHARGIDMDWDGIARFAALVRADEREACAKLMDDMAAKDTMTNYYKVAARAIRERKS
jgi:hypothetical protein